MDAPGTRYKVVERGRRLEVIDTWNNNAPVKPIRAEAAPPPRDDARGAIEQMRAPRLDQRGGRMLNTKPWYDAKAPRTILLNEHGEAKMKGLRVVAMVMLAIGGVLAFLFWPLLFIVPFVVMNGETRKSLRKASTKYLDEINQPAAPPSAG